MVCKEEVVTLFKEFSSYKRVDLMCTLMNMCLPFELRFMGTCIEELGKRDYSQLREYESRANNQADLADVSCVAEKHARSILTVYLSLLHSTNQTCSGLIFKKLASLAANDYAELGQALSGCGRVSSSAVDESLPAAEDNPLEELLLLYSMALNHPAFTYEQKALFGNILIRLQEEEAKSAAPQKRIVCVKTGIPPMYMPCAPCTISSDGSAAVAQHFAPVPGKYLLPAAMAGRFTGDMSKGLPEMSGHYFVAPAMYCSMPPPNMVSSVPPTPGTPSDFTVCPPAPYVMPAMSQPPCPQSEIVAATVNVPYPVNDSPYVSPIASPPRSPNVSRCGSPVVVWNATTGQPTGTFKNCYTSPNHNENSSSSSTCSGGSTGGGGGGSAYRTNRSSNHPRNKQMIPNGQIAVDEQLAIKNVEPLRIPVGDNLPEVMSNMTIGPAMNGVIDPNRGQRMHGDEKRCWAPSGSALAPNSAGSSQSGTPSPPITPPQEENWDYKEENVAGRWEKGGRGVVGMSSGGSRFHHPRGPPMRRVEGAKGAQRLQQQPMQQSTQPPPMPSTFYVPALQQVQANGTLYPVNRHAWAVQSSTDGKLFQHSPFFLPLMTAHGAASGPASFPPSYSTPNGNMQQPPDYMTMPPLPSQKSPPPYSHPFMPPAKQTSPPHHYAHPYPQPLPASNHKESCFNCGAIGHRGNDCTDPSIQDVLKKGMYHLDYSSPAASETVVGASVMVGGIAPPPATLEK